MLAISMDLHEKCRIAFLRKNEKQESVHLVECRKKRTAVVLKMCLLARASLARMHYSETAARLRLIYRLHISSRFHRERERLRRVTAQQRHLFVLSPYRVCSFV